MNLKQKIFENNIPAPVKIIVISILSMIFGFLFGWVAFPKIFQSQLKKQMSLAKGTDIRDMWTTIPFPLDYKIYVFNCTNPKDVMKGSKPIVKEVGPYYYEEWKEKVNLVDIEKEDAITYNTRDTFYFKQEKSGPGLTGEEVVMVPHILIISTAYKVHKVKPSMLKLVGQAIQGIYDQPETVFMAVKVKDILFDGFIGNCNRIDFAPKAVCTVMKKEVESVEFFGNNQFKFSLLGRINGTIDNRTVKVLRGIKNIMDVGKVIEFDGKPAQTVWDGDECNKFNGTDGTIFPPFLTENDTLQTFTPAVCRSFGAYYVEKSGYVNIPTNLYMADFGDLSNETINHCFCDTPDTCPAKGLMDVTKCLDAPFTVSLPHYLEVDQAVQDTIEGLIPDVAEHGIFIDFEPISGTPVKAVRRIQFNLLLPKIDKLELFKNLPNTHIPFFWIEEGLALNKTFTRMLNRQLFIPLRIVKSLKWLMVWGGLTWLVVGSMLYQKMVMVKLATIEQAKKQESDNNAAGNENTLNALTPVEKSDTSDNNHLPGAVEQF